MQCLAVAGEFYLPRSPVIAPAGDCSRLSVTGGIKPRPRDSIGPAVIGFAVISPAVIGTIRISTTAINHRGKKILRGASRATTQGRQLSILRFTPPKPKAALVPKANRVGGAAAPAKAYTRGRRPRYPLYEDAHLLHTTLPGGESGRQARAETKNCRLGDK